MKIEKYNSQPPETPFQWRDQQGNFHYPKDMETRHVFFTLRMIWNHAAPEEFRIEPYKRYTFLPYYTEEYMARAVRELYRELQSRTDLTPYYKKCLTHMRLCMKKAIKDK